ncbi:MAG: T9SS type A sorting domain-containing protein [Sphingobacteriales bacterium]|nr:MAG: T9SS type A sorting domain-containing protein [Sphingobacteriales bacterium]
MKKTYTYIFFAALLTLFISLGFIQEASAQQSARGGNDIVKVTSSFSPNPAKEKTTFHFQNTGRETYRLEIFDIIGNQVKLVNDIQTNAAEVDISDLEAGMYFYFLVRGSDRVSTGRLIIKQ